MLFSAGLGTRLKPFTETAPKPMLPINGKPLLIHNLDYLHYYGIREICINIHYFPEQILECVTDYQKLNKVEVYFSDETEALLETGGGLAKARSYFDNEKSFLALNSDILSDVNLADLISYHQKSEDTLATLAVSKRTSSRYLSINERQELVGWINEKTGEHIGEIHLNNTFAFSGLHCINSTIFDLMPSNGKFSIMQEYLRLMSREKILTYVHDKDIVDVGKPESIPIAENKLKQYHWYNETR